MIRINLLGKKKLANIPFGLDERLEKLGVSGDELLELRPALVRVMFVVVGLYVANFVPTYLHEEKVKELDRQVHALTTRATDLQKELATKKDIRKQMDQLNKEEVELQRQLNAVSALQQGRGLAFNTLNDIMVQLGKTGKVWIDDLKFDRKTITMTGRSWEYFAINDFVKSITESTKYYDVLFKSIEAEAPKFKMIPGVPEALQKTKRFSLEFKVKEGE